MITRRYPRTINEAFPSSAEYSCAIERPMDKPDRIVVNAALAAAFALAVLVITEFFNH